MTWIALSRKYENPIQCSTSSDRVEADSDSSEKNTSLSRSTLATAISTATPTHATCDARRVAPRAWSRPASTDTG